jgi:hypothetical protein
MKVWWFILDFMIHDWEKRRVSHDPSSEIIFLLLMCRPLLFLMGIFELSENVTE